MEQIAQRKNPRLRGYNYANPNYYFITICTRNKSHVFGSVQKLNICGKIVEDGIRKIPLHFEGVAVDKYVIMPNHVHMIVVLDADTANVSDIVGNFKAYVTRKIHGTGYVGTVWQRSFHDHIIRNQRSYEMIWNYIEGNPQQWEEDCFYTDEK